METRGKKWEEVREKRTSLAAHGFTQMDIRGWRTREYEANRPYRLEDFYAQHNLCFKCKCDGVQFVGRDEAGTELWDLCEVCGGTGSVAGLKGTG